MIQLAKDTSASLIDSKVTYESLCQAVRIAQKDLDGTLAIQDAQELIHLRDKAKEEYMIKVKCLIDLVSSTPVGKKETNLLEIWGGWYGIVYSAPTSDNGYDIKLELLIEKDLYMLEREGSNIRHYTRKELETLLPAYIDEEALERYKAVLKSKALELLHEHIPSYYGDPSLANNGMKPSKHAGKRWVQRVMKVALMNWEAENYYKENTEEVNTEIFQAFSTAEKIWEGEEGIQYWFDENNMMYVVDSNNNIVTLYEEDFGFSKEINRNIVLMQIEEVKKSNDSLRKAEKKYQLEEATANRDLSKVDREIQSLKCKIEFLEASKSNYLADLEVENKKLQLERDTFSKNYDKLFKKKELILNEYN